jgi:hypothetical protein
LERRLNLLDSPHFTGILSSLLRFAGMLAGMVAAFDTVARMLEQLRADAVRLLTYLARVTERGCPRSV